MAAVLKVGQLVHDHAVDDLGPGAGPKFSVTTRPWGSRLPHPPSGLMRSAGGAGSQAGRRPARERRTRRKTLGSFAREQTSIARAARRDRSDRGTKRVRGPGNACGARARAVMPESRPRNVRGRRPSLRSDTLIRRIRSSWRIALAARYDEQESRRCRPRNAVQP